MGSSPSHRLQTRDRDAHGTVEARRSVEPPYASREALEAQADEIAGLSDAGWSGLISSRAGTEAIPAALRRPVEERLGFDFSKVRIHTGPRASEELASQSADAVARGDDIYVQSESYLPSQAESRRLVRHELVHVAQQRTGADPETARMRAVEAALKPDLGPLPATPGRAQRGACSKSEGSKAYDKLKAGHTLTQAEARAVMKAYDDLSDAEQWKMVREIYSYQAKTPPIQRLLESLSDADRFETHRDSIKSMLYKVQQVATESAAGMSMTDMAKTQGAFMEKEAQAEALKKAQAEAKAKGAPPPTTVTKEETRKSHEKSVSDRSIAPPPPKNEWDAIVDKPAWWKTAKEVRKKVVAACAKKAPHLKIVESDIDLDPETIAKRGKNIFSLAGRPMTVGISFITTAAANPDYVVGSVLHEVHGHPLHGGLTEGLEWKLYDESTKHFPSYTKPADRGQEHDLYGYIGTEIFAEMMESDYTVPVTPADAKKGVTGSDDPAWNIGERIELLKARYEPTVAKSLVLGLWERFRVDPRLSAKALGLYKTAANQHFPGLIK